MMIIFLTIAIIMVMAPTIAMDIAMLIVVMDMMSRSSF